jgi:hypothetical protein
MFLTRALSKKLPLNHISFLCLTALALVASPAAHGATINYGNFNVPPAGIMFNNVTESSGTDPVPLFGPPDPFVVGLDFDPTSFVATANGGASDITDGQLNFTIMGLVNPGGYVGISNVNLFEAGDFTLTGVGTAATQALAGAIIRATVTQINGLPVAPISLAPSNASVGFNLVANPGVVQPWSLGVGLNIAGQLAAGQVATKVEISINNSLIALSQASSLSFIAKKDFRIDLTPTTVGQPFVPEPGTLVLAGLASVIGLAWRRSRS